MTLKIRWRLMLWNTLGLAIMLLAFAAVVFGLMHHALYQQVDRKLVDAVGQLKQDSRLSTEPDQRLRYWIYEWREHDNLSAVVYDAEGKVRQRTVELAADTILPAPSVTAHEHRLQDKDIPVYGRQRVLEAGLLLDGRPSTVVVMASLEMVDHELAELGTVLAMAVPLMLLLSGGLGYALARKALAPLERLRRSAEDITADRLHRRLPVANSHDELGRLTGTFNAMIGRLERSFAEVRRFTADASHELRTPLTAIRTEAEVALAKPLGLAEYQQLLGSILEECSRLTRLTDQLLALARQDSSMGQPALEPVDLAAVVEDVAETMRPLAEAKQLRLLVEVNRAVWVNGDLGQLREVFFNLLDNGIKYTPEGGEVAVRIGHNGPVAVVTVRDTGIGILPEHLPHVFDRFYRVDKARSRAEGGTGLGLSIAQSIIAAHGGQIELDSTPGQGTTCTVKLPLGSRPHKTPNSEEAS
jgi:heavy metal sensor kinase